MSLACECVLTYEVVTKHIPVLDALRGLDLVCVMVSTGIDLVISNIHKYSNYYNIPSCFK